MEKVIKIRCPHCAGKIAIDDDYFRELSCKIINCPHCQAEMIVPAAPPPFNPKMAELKNVSATTMNLKPLIDISVSESPGHPTVRCPHCGAEVGVRDRVCLNCEGVLKQGGAF